MTLPALVLLDANGLPFSTASTPRKIITGTGNDPRPRLRVDEGSTGFYEGREFRMFLELNVPPDGHFWVRHTISSNFILHDQRVSIQSGNVRWSAVAATATSPGPWTPATFRRRNQMTEQPTPFYTSTSVLETSTATAAATGGFEVDIMRVASSTQGNSYSSISQNAGQRGLAPGVYHVHIQNLSSQDPIIGVYDWWWEERLPDSVLI